MFILVRHPWWALRGGPSDFAIRCGDTLDLPSGNFVFAT